jgi:hypothetical protein
MASSVLSSGMLRCWKQKLAIIFGEIVLAGITIEVLLVVTSGFYQRSSPDISHQPAIADHYLLPTSGL